MNKNRHEFIIVGLLIIIALFLRVYKINTDLLFHRDQGLHSLAIWNIWHDHKFSLLGPLTDVIGIVHAPIYYWFMLPAYALSGGDPAAASAFQIITEVASLLFLYLGLMRLFNRQTALLTLFLYSISYGLICYSRWLINVTPIISLSHLFIYLLSLFLTGKPSVKIYFLLCLTTGLMIQMDAAVGVFVIPFLIYLLFSPSPKLGEGRGEVLKKLFLFFAGILLPALPLLVFELRHHFVISRAILGLLNSPSQGAGFNLTTLTNNFQIFFTEISHIFLPSFYLTSTLVFILSLILLYPHKYSRSLYLFILLPIIILAFLRRGAISFFFIELLPLSLAIIINAVLQLPKLTLLPVVGLIVYFNVIHLPKIYQPTNALIPIGNASLITLQDRKNILDWAYQKAEGKPFSVWFYTKPYFQEEVWNYLLLWYAEKKYGYLPEKTSGFSKQDLTVSQSFFAIWEPDADQPVRLESWQNDVLINFGPAISTFSSHDLHVTFHPIPSPY